VSIRGIEREILRMRSFVFSKPGQQKNNPGKEVVVVVVSYFQTCHCSYRLYGLSPGIAPQKWYHIDVSMLKVSTSEGDFLY